MAFVVKKHGSSLSQEAVTDYVAGQVLYCFIVSVSSRTSPTAILLTLHCTSLCYLSTISRATSFVNRLQLSISSARMFIFSGCTLQEGQKGSIYTFNTKICSWEDPPEGTREALDI